MLGGQQQPQTDDPGATPTQQPQTDWRSIADAAASIPNALYISRADRTYPGLASDRGALCSFISSPKSFVAAGIVVLLSLIAVGLTPLTFINKEEISELSTTVDALKRDRQYDMSTAVDALKRVRDDMRRLSTTVDALKRNQDDMSTTVDALKRDQDDMSTAVDALKRDQDDMSTAVDALKRDQDDMRQLSTTVDALKRNQDDMSTTVDALKRDQDDMSTTVDALKRDQDDMRQLSTTVDALKRNQDNMRQLSTTVDALKRVQDNMRQLSTTVDALKRVQDDMRQLYTTVDALKRDQDDMLVSIDKERSQIPALEQRLHEMSKTLASCTKGYAVFRGICYKAFNTRQTFSDASAACGEDDATLAMPRDAGINAFLISLYKSVSDKGDFWFGLHDQRDEGSFEWVDGSALGMYNSWHPLEPNNAGGHEDCVLYLQSHKDKWNDCRCDWPAYFICQAVPGISCNHLIS
uniref:C-type lectin domain-containing protein n=1 Tax=Branchiostoma floridae TaxID=7739 RepID=C3YCY9_BRAFL|eukprot:XP_002605930.1 hypothetical protein BRAFLDRAFT_87395 [Branchiostoma floridae]